MSEGKKSIKFEMFVRPWKIDEALKLLIIQFPYAWISAVGESILAEFDLEEVDIHAQFSAFILSLQARSIISTEMSAEQPQSDEFKAFKENRSIPRLALEQTMLQTDKETQTTITRRLNALFRCGFMTGDFSKTHTQRLAPWFLMAILDSKTFDEFLLQILPFLSTSGWTGNTETLKNHMDTEQTIHQIKSKITGFNKDSFNFWKRTLKKYLNLESIVD